MELITKIRIIIQYVNIKYRVKKELTKAYFTEEDGKFYFVLSLKFLAEKSTERLIYIEDIMFANITNTELDNLIIKSIMSSYIEKEYYG